MDRGVGIELNDTGDTLRRLERYIYNLQPARELNTLSRTKREVIAELRDSITAAKTSYNHLQAAEEPEEIKAEILQTIEFLAAVHEAILEASNHDLLSPADVASLSALNEHISDRLKINLNKGIK